MDFFYSRGFSPFRGVFFWISFFILRAILSAFFFSFFCFFSPFLFFVCFVVRVLGFEFWSVWILGFLGLDFGFFFLVVAVLLSCCLALLLSYYLTITNHPDSESRGGNLLLFFFLFVFFSFWEESWYCFTLHYPLLSVWLEYSIGLDFDRIKYKIIWLILCYIVLWRGIDLV